MKKYCFAILFLIAIHANSHAELMLPKILGHNMVLQQGEPVSIWGWANSNEQVTVSFHEQKKVAIADDKGAWQLKLDPMRASFEPATLRIASTKDKIELNNILVGEVWLCSGQSNMEFAMRKLVKLKPPAGANWPTNEVAEANNKALRIFLVERKKMKPDSTHAGWNVGEGIELKNFSAVAYFFAKELSQRLKVPVGVISAAVPGSRIEPWMPEEAMTLQPFFKENKNKPEGKIDGDPEKFYTTMIEPLIPFSIKGFLWYQGESNCFLNERISYSYKMKALIDYWRNQWNNNQLPFYYVQIAPYYYSKAKDRPYTIYSEPEFWEAQAAVLKVPGTTMIATIDLNDDPADLHPVNKWDVGQRLANAALSKTYKVNNAQPMGPIFKTESKTKNGIWLDFDFKGKGLKGTNGNKLSGFEIAGADGNFIPADAIIKNDKVWVSPGKLKHPVAVRYAWREDAKATLFNSDGLPALPFRTDNPIAKMFTPK